MKKALLFFCLTLITVSVYSQQLPTINLLVEKPSSKEFKIEFNNSFITKRPVVFDGVLNNSSINASIEIEKPTEIRVTIDNKYFNLFLKPRESIRGTYDGSELKLHNSLDSEFAQRYQRLTENEQSSIRLKEVDPKEYLKIMNKKYLTAFNLLQEFKDSISEECYYYYYYDNIFRNAYQKLAIRRYQSPQKLGEDYFSFLNDVPKDLDPSSGVPFYHDFLYEYMVYKQAGSKKSVKALDILLKRSRVKQYHFAESLFQGHTLEYLRAYIIIKAFYNKEKHASIYKHYLKEYPQSEWQDDLLFQTNENARISLNKLAPEFTLETDNGDNVSLSNFRGRVTYIIFWTNSCKPCIENFPNLKKLQEDFKDQEVAFVYISLDKSKDVWKRSISKYELSGVHINADWNQMSSVYNFTSIPHYILIDKKGEISGFQQPNNPMIRSYLRKLL